MNDKQNAQSSPATPDTGGKDDPIDKNCCTIPGGGDPGPGGPTG